MLVNDQIVREDDNDVELFAVVLLLEVDAVVEPEDVLLDVVEESRCCRVVDLDLELLEVPARPAMSVSSRNIQPTLSIGY